MVNLKRTTFVDFKAPVMAIACHAGSGGTKAKASAKGDGAAESKGVDGGGAVTKSAREGDVTSPFVIIGGGGGKSKTGVLNYINVYNIGSTGSGIAQLQPRCSFRLDNMVTAMALSSDAKWVAAGFVDSPACTLYRLDVAGESLDKASAFQVDFKEEEPGMNAVAFNPRRQQVVTGGEDGVVRLWNTSMDGEAKEAAKFEGHERPVADVCFHANGVLILSAAGRSLRLWSSKLGKQVGVLRGGPGKAKFGGNTKKSRKWGIWKFCAAQFTPDGNTIVALETTVRGPAVLIKYTKPEGGWEVAADSVSPTKVVSIASDPVVSMTLSADGKFVGLGGSEGEIMVYSVATLAKLHRESVQGLAITSVCFQPHTNGLTLVSGSADRSVAVTRVSTKPSGSLATVLLVAICLICVAVLVMWATGHLQLAVGSTPLRALVSGARAWRQTPVRASRWLSTALDAPIERYNDNGFAIVRGLLSAGEVSELLSEMVHICRGNRGHIDGVLHAEASATDDDVLRQYLAIHFPHKVSGRVLELVRQRKTVECLTQVVGPNVKCMQTMMFMKAAGLPGQAPHQDEYFIPTRDRSLTATWIALDAATLENGCLWVIPGSHKRGVLYPSARHDRPEFDGAPMCYGYPYDDERDWVPVPLEPGDGLFFSGYLLHKSTPNRSASAFRRAFANHYMSAESLLPWNNDKRVSADHIEDLRDVLLVAGKDPYEAFRPAVDNLTQPYVRANAPSDETFTHEVDRRQGE